MTAKYKLYLPTVLIAVKRSLVHFTKLDVLCAVFKQYRLQNMCMADGTAITRYCTAVVYVHPI